MQPVQGSKFNPLWIVIGVIGGVFCLGGVCCMGSCALTAGGMAEASKSLEEDLAKEEQKVQAAASQPALQVTPLELWSAYDGNTVSADQMYKNRKLKVTGKVSEVKEMFGEFHVYLEVPGQPLGSIDVTYPESARSMVAQISKGTTITVTGVCDGERMSIVSLKGTAD